MTNQNGQKFGFIYNGQYYYYMYNIQGDVIGIWDNNGNIVARYNYNAWGKPISVTDGNGNDVSSNPSHIANINPIRYRGYYYDQETGFYYVGSRYYDPEIGRWINADGVLPSSADSVQGYNLFVYGFNNPINTVDPSGNWPKWLSNIGNAIVKVAKTVASVFTSFTAEAGFGTGFRGSATVAGVEITAGYKYDLENVKVNAKGVDIGKEEKLGASIGFNKVKYASIGIEKGFYHSDVCDGYNKEKDHDANICPNTVKYDFTPTPNIELVGIDVYCFIGVSASIGWDYEHFSKEFVEIWYE